MPQKVNYIVLGRELAKVVGTRLCEDEITDVGSPHNPTFTATVSCSFTGDDSLQKATGTSQGATKKIASRRAHGIFVQTMLHDHHKLLMDGMEKDIRGNEENARGRIHPVPGNSAQAVTVPGIQPDVPGGLQGRREEGILVQDTENGGDCTTETDEDDLR